MSTNADSSALQESKHSCLQQIRIPNGSKYGTCRVQCEHFSMDITYHVDGEDLKLSIQKPLLKISSTAQEITSLDQSSSSITRGKRHRCSELRSHSRCSSLHRRSKGKTQRQKKCPALMDADKINSRSSTNMISCASEKPHKYAKLKEELLCDKKKPGRKPGVIDISAKDIKDEKPRTSSENTKLVSRSEIESVNSPRQSKLKSYRNVSVMVKPIGDNLPLDGSAKKIRRPRNRHPDKLQDPAKSLLKNGSKIKVLKHENPENNAHHIKSMDSDSITSDEHIKQKICKKEKRKGTKKKNLVYQKLKNDEDNDNDLLEIQNGSPDVLDIAIKAKDVYEKTESKQIIMFLQNNEADKIGVSSTTKDETVTSSNALENTLKFCLRTRSSAYHKFRSKSLNWKDNTNFGESWSMESVTEKIRIDTIACSAVNTIVNNAEPNPIVITSTSINDDLNLDNSVKELSTESSKSKAAIEPISEITRRTEDVPEQDSFDVLKGNGKDLHRCTSGMVVNHGKDLHACRELQRTLQKSIKSIKSCVHESCQSSFTDLDDLSNATKCSSGPIRLQETSEQSESRQTERLDLPDGTTAEEAQDPLLSADCSPRKFSTQLLSEMSTRSETLGIFPASEIAIQRCSKIIQKKMKQAKHGDKIQEPDHKDIARSCPMMRSPTLNDTSVSVFENQETQQSLDELNRDGKSDNSQNNSYNEIVLIENSSRFSNETEIGNWSESNDISNEISSLCFNDKGVLINGSSLHIDALQKFIESKSIQNCDVEESNRTIAGKVLRDIVNDTCNISNDSLRSPRNKTICHEGSNAQMTNVLIMQCMIPQGLKPPPGPSQKLKNTTNFQNETLKSILLNQSSSVVSKVMECDGFSIIVDEDQKNHKCKVVFAPSRSNELINYMKHEETGTQPGNSSLIELKPVCAFVTTPMLNQNFDETSSIPKYPIKSERSSSDKDTMKTVKKSKYRRATLKSNCESKSKPYEVKRRLCKSSRYIDKVIHDLSVDPIMIPKDNQDEEEIVCLAEAKGDEKAKKKSKHHVYCETPKNTRQMENKATMPDFNIDAAHEKTTNCQGTMPDFNIDCEENMNQEAEISETCQVEDANPGHDVGIQMNPEGSILDNPSNSVSEEDTYIESKKPLTTLNNVATIQKSSSDEVIAGPSATSERSRKTTPLTPSETSGERSRRKALMSEMTPRSSCWSSVAPSVDTTASPERSRQMSWTSEPAPSTSPEDGSVSEVSTKRNSEDDSIKSVNANSPSLERVDCQKYLDNMHVYNITPEKFAECFQLGLQKPSDGDQNCDENSIKLYYNMKLADFFLSLGHSADDCYRMGKDVVLCLYLKSALNEAMIWCKCLSQNQGHLILRLSDETRCFPHVKQYFLRLVEAIVNRRIENNAMLDSFLNLITFMETGQLSRRSMLGYEHVDDRLAKKNINSSQVQAMFMTLKKTATKMANKNLTNKEDVLLQELAQRAIKSSKLKMNHCKTIARYIGSGKITYKFRLKAAIDFMELQNKIQVDMKEFEKYCGVTNNEHNY